MKESVECKSQKLKVVVSLTKPLTFLAVTNFYRNPKSPRLSASVCENNTQYDADECKTMQNYVKVLESKQQYAKLN